MDETVLLFLEKICEAIYFSLFIIYGKGLKEKRILFIAIMIFEYLLLKSFLHYNIWFSILYIVTTFLTLKVLYKNKSQITDIFLMAAASIIIMIISLVCALMQIYFNINYKILLIINRIILFLIIFLLRNKIRKIYEKYYSHWNRKNNTSGIRSLTVRNISIIIFNLMFAIMNIGFIYILLTKK